MSLLPRYSSKVQPLFVWVPTEYRSNRHPSRPITEHCSAPILSQVLLI